MRIACNSKIPKLLHKKEAFVKTQRAVSSSITGSNEIRSSKTEMEVAATVEAAAEVSMEERRQLISEAAYYRAERRSFTPGYELDDWFNAEAEIETILSTSSTSHLSKNL
jgi:hypothetical protein